MTSRLEQSRYPDLSHFCESIGIGLKNFGLEKSLGIGLENIWSKKSLSNDLKKFSRKSRGIGLKNFGLGNGLIEFGLPTSPNMPNMPNNEQHV